MKITDLNFPNMTLELTLEEYTDLIGFALESPNINKKMLKPISENQRLIHKYLDRMTEHLKVKP